MELAPLNLSGPFLLAASIFTASIFRGSIEALGESDENRKDDFPPARETQLPSPPPPPVTVGWEGALWRVARLIVGVIWWLSQ